MTSHSLSAPKPRPRQVVSVTPSHLWQHAFVRDHPAHLLAYAAALQQRAWGRSVVPVRRKVPHGEALFVSGHGYEDADGQHGRWMVFQDRPPTTDELWTWFVTCKATGLAMVTGKVSGIVVLDFDGEAGKQLLGKFGLKPHVRTPSGGLHLYVVHPGWRVPTLNSKVHEQLAAYKGLDIRADGGYAVMPPTVRDGKAYQELRDLTPDSLDVLPDELRGVLGLLHAPVAAPRPVRTISFRPSGSSQDRLLSRALEVAAFRGRNEAGFWLCCKLRDRGLGLEEAETVLELFAAQVGGENTKGEHEAYGRAKYMASLRSAYRIEST